ncbi:MAG: YceI family protein [Chitinophagaceae bacterium]|nr:YceI family protein [Chitinophagaceae bacterium]
MKIFFTSILLLFVNLSFAQQFKPVDEGSEVKFKIRNFGVNVSGTFSGLKGQIVFHPDNLSTAEFDVTIDSKTIKTGIDQRDNHLKQEEYFDADKYPRIHFASTKITTSTDKAYLFVFGKLTIKGVTKEISFPFKATPKGDDYLFEGEFKINRRDYTVGGGSITMADELTVILSVMGKKE